MASEFRRQLGPVGGYGAIRSSDLKQETKIEEPLFSFFLVFWIKHVFAFFCFLFFEVFGWMDFEDGFGGVFRISGCFLVGLLVLNVILLTYLLALCKYSLLRVKIVYFVLANPSFEMFWDGQL